jgi:2-C-methyl-D-erythritol 2,4-cyclodiphosphate synthase
MGHRVGLGYDVHPFAEGRQLILGGVTIDHPRGLAAHSDGDAICHALSDALLGTFALGDMGKHFPDSDPRWQGADSVEMLRHVVALVAGRGGRPVHADVTVIADEPRLTPHVDTMRERLAGVLGIAMDHLSIKATRTEGLGPLADGAGLSAQAVVLVTDDSDG